MPPPLLASLGTTWTNRSQGLLSTPSGTPVQPAIPATPLVTFDASNTSLMTSATPPITVLAPLVTGADIGNWNGAVQATQTLAPCYVDNAIGGGPCVWYGQYARPDLYPGTLPLAVAASVYPSLGVSIPFTMCWLGTCNNSTGNATAPILELGNVGTGVGVYIDSLGIIKVHGPSGTLTATATWTLGDNKLHDLFVWCDGTSIFAELDGVSVTVTPTGTAPGTGSITGNLTIGTDHQIVDTAMQIGGVCFHGWWNRILTLADRAGFRAYSKLGWYRGNPSASPTINWIAIGDSLQHGDVTTNQGSDELVVLPYAHGHRAADAIGPYVTFNNISVGGSRLTILNSGFISALAQWTTLGEPAATAASGTDIIVTIYSTTNDIVALNPTDGPSAIADAATIEGYFATLIGTIAPYLAGITSGPKGHRIIIETTGAWLTGFYDQCRTLVNASVVSTYDNTTQSGIKTNVVQSGEDVLINNAAPPGVGLWWDGDGLNHSFPGIVAGPHGGQLWHNRLGGLDILKLRQLNYLPGTLMSIVVTPSTAALVLGGPKQYKAIATFSDVPPLDVTSVATWGTSASGVATIAAGGLLTPVANGSCNVTATFGGMMGTTTATVSTVTPATILGAGLAAWYRSDLGVTQSGTVTGYADQSGNSHNLSVLATQSAPPYATSGGINNRPYIVPGDGTSQALSTTTFSNAQPFEFIIVMRMTNGAPGGGRYAIDFSAPPGGANIDALLQAAAGASIQLYPGPSTAALALGEHWIDCICNGASSSISADGGTPVVGTVSASPSGITLFNVGVGSPSQSMGHFHYELIVGTGLFTGSQRTALLAYINALYT